MPDLLLELLSEEIPARMQPRAREDLKRMILGSLEASGLTAAGAHVFSTPRRLTLYVAGLPARTPDQTEERRGPRADAPEQAIEGFLRGAGVTRDQLEVRADKKGDVLFAIIQKPGRDAAEAVKEAVETAVRTFPWPKSMRWGSGDLRWVRPLHSIICLLGERGQPGAVVPVEIETVSTGRTTRGHRVMSPAPFEVDGFEDYAVKLAKAHVILDQDERRRRIEADLAKAAAQLGLELVPDDGLLAEVAGLVEWPVVVTGVIDEEFRGLPPEVLQTSMRAHQKFFSLRDPENGVLTHFATVANLRASDGGAKIRAGNERVLRARLSDARFFWDNDLAHPLEDRLPALEAVVFHAQLGPQSDRVARLRALAQEVADALGFDVARADRAAELAKADLTSAMVYEFPELQGLMGRYYAAHGGEEEDVAAAIEDHYRPVGANDAPPKDPVSIAVALADKLDLLTCFWAIDEKPTGSKDPYALRRAALGVIRILLENDLRLPLRSLIARHYFLAERARQNAAFAESDESDALRRNRVSRVLEALYVDDVEGAQTAAALDRAHALEGLVADWMGASHAVADDLMGFIADRLKVYLRDRGARHDVLEAAFAGGVDDIALGAQRADALARLLGDDDGANLLAAYRRAANIVRAESRKDGGEYSRRPDPGLLEAPEEVALFKALTDVEAQVETRLEAGAFDEAMSAMASLRPLLDAFFENVTVNAEDEALRRNRLRLLTRLGDVMERIGDLSKLEG